MIVWIILFWLVGIIVFYRPLALVPSEANVPPRVITVYAAAVASLANLVPSMGEMKSFGMVPNWRDPVTASWVFLQKGVGWIFIALLARRFFAGLVGSGKEQK